MKDIVCIKDCYMTNKEHIFTKGKIYHPYTYHYCADPNSIVETVAAKDDDNVRHVIKQVYPERKDTFFDEHFIELND